MPRQDHHLQDQEQLYHVPQPNSARRRRRRPPSDAHSAALIAAAAAERKSVRRILELCAEIAAAPVARAAWRREHGGQRKHAGEWRRSQRPPMVCLHGPFLSLPLPSQSGSGVEDRVRRCCET